MRRIIPAITGETDVSWGSGCTVEESRKDMKEEKERRMRRGPLEGGIRWGKDSGGPFCQSRKNNHIRKTHYDPESNTGGRLNSKLVETQARTRQHNANWTWGRRGRGGGKGVGRMHVRV